MDLKKIHDILDFYLVKEQGGYFSPEEKDAVLNRAQYQLFEQAKPAYSVNQQVDDLLLPFKKEQSFTNASCPLGLITLNSDYYHLLTVETVAMDGSTVLYIPVEKVGEDELSFRRNSQLIPITSKHPIGMLKAPATIGGQYRFQIYPQTASAGIVYYLRKPQEVEFKYSQSGRTITYNSGTSKQLEWNEAGTEKIVFLALQLLGINVKDINVVQFAQAKGGES